jgi:hypothetical protein
MLYCYIKLYLLIIFDITLPPQKKSNVLHHCFTDCFPCFRTTEAHSKTKKCLPSLVFTKVQILKEHYKKMGNKMSKLVREYMTISSVGYDYQHTINE